MLSKKIAVNTDKITNYALIPWSEFIDICLNYANKDITQVKSGLIKNLSDFYMSKQSIDIQKKFYEYLSVFDKDENYIGEANWYFVHKFGYIYSASAVILFNSQTGKMLLQKRSLSVSWPNLLDCSAGGCFSAEVKDEKSRILEVNREINEELFSNKKDKNNYELKNIGRIFINTIKNNFIKKQFMYVYILEIENIMFAELVGNEEISSLIWKTPKELMQINKTELAPGLLAVIEEIDLERLLKGLT